MREGPGMKAWLQPGFEVRPMPFGGALLVDRERLAVVEVDDEVARLVGAASPIDVDRQPERLRARLASGVAEGWLTVEDST
jgi:hypothetical protein